MSPDAKILMCGCAEIGAHLLGRLARAGIRFSHVLTLTPEQAQTYHVSGYQDLRPAADALNIPWSVPSTYSLTRDHDLAFFERGRFDLLIQGGWQRLFPEPVLASLGIGAVGVHGSADFLPKGRGRSPLNWSIIERKTRFLLHLFLIRAGVDDGDVFDVEDFDINPFDDIDTLYLKLVIVKERMLVRSLPGLLGGTLPTRPQRGIPSFYPKRSPEDGRVDWETMDVHAVCDMVRALTRPYPGAFAELDGAVRSLWKARLFDTRITYPDAPYGAVVERFGKRLVVNCLGGLLLVDDHEPRP